MVMERPAAWRKGTQSLAITLRIESVPTPAEYGGCPFDANVLYIARNAVAVVGRSARAWRCLGPSGLPVDREVKPYDVEQAAPSVG